MKDKDNICFHACLYAIAKLMEKGSCRYSWKNDDGEWNSIAWNEIMNWILEKFNAKSEAIPLDKIKAEIEDLTYYCCEVHPRNVIDDVLYIINKYKKEGEQK